MQYFRHNPRAYFQLFNINKCHIECWFPKCKWKLFFSVSVLTTNFDFHGGNFQGVWSSDTIGVKLAAKTVISDDHSELSWSLEIGNLFLILRPFPSNTNLFKVNNRKARKRCQICSKLTIKTPERCQQSLSGVFIFNFEH